MKIIDIDTLNLSRKEEEKFFEEELISINDDWEISEFIDDLNEKLKPYNLEMVSYDDKSSDYWLRLENLKETVVK